MRSLLFVPADNERKIAKALASDADALILDLEDAIAPDRKTAARAMCAEALASAGGAKPVFVRINPLGTPEALADLATVVRRRPSGIMLPKCAGTAPLATLSAHLAALEARDGVPAGSIAIIPIVTELAASVLGLGDYAKAARSPRLFGMLWGGEDLAADIGAAANRDPDGRYTPVYELSRSLTLLAAAGAGALPIDAVHVDFRDLGRLRAEAEAAVRDGFRAKAAIHPDQVAVINEIFSPGTAQVDWARAVVAAFAASPEKGAVALGGRMLDRPHLKAARSILDRHAAGVAQTGAVAHGA